MIQHYSNIWNALDLSGRLVSLLGVLLRIAYQGETTHSQGSIAVASVLVWMKVTHICTDMHSATHITDYALCMHAHACTYMQTYIHA